MTNVNRREGSKRLADLLDAHIRQLVDLAPSVRDSPSPRVSRLFPLYSAVIEDAISIRLLCDGSRTNQAYIIARALLERLINYCYLQLCLEVEYKDFLDYTVNKAARRLDRAIEADGKVRARVAYEGGSFELPPELAAAVARFTSERGREKTRWTSVSLPERAAVVDGKASRTGLFIALLTIYSDASEALHGTIYGAVFHLGAYDMGATPTDQASLEMHFHTTLSSLYLMVGGCLGDLLKFLAAMGESYAERPAQDALALFKAAALEVGLYS